MVRVPAAEAGLVVRYSYLWRYEADRGRENSKDRPACIVAAVAQDDGGKVVVLLPITHLPPAADTVAIEIPPRVKAHLGLDQERSWVIVSECNVDIWPSPDLVQIPGRSGACEYGYLPPRLFELIRDEFLNLVRRKRVITTRRLPH
jgi:hypothetical protein